MFKNALKLVAWMFVLLLSWSILENTPHWALELIIFVLSLKTLNLWAQRDAWSTRYLVKLGYEDWSNARSEVCKIFLEERAPQQGEANDHHQK